MSIQTAGRAAAARLLTDTFEAFAPATSTTLNASGQESDAPVSQGNVLGRLRDRSSGPERLVSVGGVERPVIEDGLRIAVSDPAPSIGWEYLLTTAGPNTDASLEGSRWHVVGVQADSYATARRLNVVRVDA